ncbi:pyrophosphate-energized vacuolar membrane proton pump-like [Quercus lobata]|uniref:pyrophosphate-energized vacuolar membrane proton pump-like n=1 Tax=Quercus lobata TaxID=97700 RepID=UPI001243BDAD|nr:pyrophosphate-energized vacuolar membrane proton pump-like [Quercus lobata]
MWLPSLDLGLLCFSGSWSPRSRSQVAMVNIVGMLTLLRFPSSVLKLRMPYLLGFAIGSAALVSLALFAAFVSKAGINIVDVLTPKVFIGLLVGAMLPYWFSAMTMKSVGSAALKMVEEVRRQFNTIPGLMEGRAKPDYATCVKISTDASLREMIPPGALVMLTPLIAGTFFGVETLAGVLAGSLVSGVQVAISASNTGGAWDNAKKYIEASTLLFQLLI